MPTAQAGPANNHRRCLRAAAARFGRARDGVAAIEFALILPVMILMYLGLTELSIAYGTSRKLTLLSRSLADLTARTTKVSSDNITSIFAAATAILQPYSSTPASMVLTSVTVGLGFGNLPIGTVDWSCAKLASGATIAKRAKYSLYPVPAGFETASSFILAETTYKYVPLFGSGFTPSGGYNLSQTTAWPVRNSAQVTWDGTAC